MATTLNFTEVRQNLKRTLDQVVASRAPVTVTRRNAESVVLVAESEMTALLETVHLLRSPVNAARLMASIAQIHDGETVLMERDRSAQEGKRSKARTAAGRRKR
jgi:antitoxin YefM